MYIVCIFLSLLTDVHKGVDFITEDDRQCNQNADVCHHGEGGELVKVPDPGEDYHRDKEDGDPDLELTATKVCSIHITEDLKWGIVFTVKQKCFIDINKCCLTQINEAF